MKRGLLAAALTIGGLLALDEAGIAQMTQRDSREA